MENFLLISFGAILGQMRDIGWVYGARKEWELRFLMEH
jgi:hypothetical protein